MVRNNHIRVHVNVTSHPTAAWTVQQFREILAEPHGYRFVLHDRDSIYSSWCDAAVTAMGVRAAWALDSSWRVCYERATERREA